MPDTTKADDKDVEATFSGGAEEPASTSEQPQSSDTPAVTTNGKGRRVTASRPFPLYNLERALTVTNAIKEKNAGNPWPPTEVAKALGIAERSSGIDNLYRASSLYGLTTGTRSASYISLEKIGREIAYAPSPEKDLLAKRQAFLNVDLFSKVVEYYKGNNLPDVKFLSNTLVNEFGVPVEFHEEFRKIFQENCSFAQIAQTGKGFHRRETSSFGRGSIRHPWYRTHRNRTLMARAVL